MSQNYANIGIAGYVPSFSIAYGSSISPFVINGIAPSSTSGFVLTSNGSSAAPSFQASAFTGTVTSVSGTANQVAVANGTTTPVISLIGPYTPATYTAHGVLLGEGISSIVATAVGSTGQVLTGVTGADPVWASPATSGTVTSVSGTSNQVAVATGTTTPVISLIGPYTPSTYTAHGVLIGEGTSSIVATAVGTTGQVLTGVTGGDPVWASPATSGTVTSVSGTANQVAVATGTTTPVISLIGPYTPSTYTSNGVLYGNGTSSLQVTSVGSTGQVLAGNTGSAPTFQTLSGLAVTSITGTANQITASASTGSVTLSTPSTFIAPGSIASTTSLTAGNGFTVTTGTSNIDGNALFKGPTPWADVVAYGADPTGAASSVAAFNAAIASIPLGGIVWIPIGTYKIDSAITVSTPHIRFCGASRTDSILNNTGTTTNTINLNTFYGGCENLTFTAPANTQTAGFAIGMSSSSDYSYVWRCDFTNMFQGIQLIGNLSYADDIGMRTFSNAASNGGGIVINGTNNCWINKLTTNNGTTLTGFAAIRLIQVSAILVSNCQLIGATIAMSIEPTVGLTVPSVEVINTFFDTSTIGLSVSGAGTPARSKFTNCWFSSQTTAGIQFNNANMTGFTFVNCDIYGNGIGVNALAATDWQVSDSRLAANTTAAFQTTASATHSFQILGNTIGPTGVFGANGNGINIQSGTYGSYRIRNNIGLQGNTTAGITDSGVVANQNQKDVSNNLGSTIKGLIATNTSATGAINTAETIVAGGKAVNGATCVIPANSLQIGNVIRITMHGTCTSTAANASTFTLRMGTAGTTGDASVGTAATSIAATSGTAVGFTAVMEFVVLTISSTGTIVGRMLLLNTGITGISANNTQSIPMTVTATLNTTTANYLEVTYKAAAATTTSTFQTAFIEVL